MFILCRPQPGYRLIPSAIMYNNKRDFAWVCDGAYIGWLQTHALSANCKAIAIKLISQPPTACPLFAGKLSVRLVKNGKVVAFEQLTLVNNNHVIIYAIDHKPVMFMSEASDVIEVFRYAGPSPRY